MYVDIAKSCLAGVENSVLSENTNSSIDEISFVPYDRIKSKKGLAFTSPFFLWEDYKKDFFGVLVYGLEPSCMGLDCGISIAPFAEFEM